MCGLTGNGCQKLRDFIDHNTIQATLNWAEKLMIDTLHLNCLVDQEDNNMTYLGLIQATAAPTMCACCDPALGLYPKTVVIMHYQTMVTYNTCICM